MFTNQAIKIHLTTLLVGIIAALSCYYTYPLMLFPVKILLTIFVLIPTSGIPFFSLIFRRFFFNPETSAPYWWDSVVNAPLTGSVFFAFVIVWLYWRKKMTVYAITRPEEPSSKPIMKYRRHIASLIAVPVAFMFYKAVSPEQLLNLTSWGTLLYCLYPRYPYWINQAEWNGSPACFYHMAAVTAFLAANHQRLAEAIQVLAKIEVELKI